MKRKIFAAVASAVAALGLGSVGRADSIQVIATFNYPSSPYATETVGISDGSVLAAGTYGVGAYQFTSVTVSAGSGPNSSLGLSDAKTLLQPSFTAVCIDFTHDISGGTTHTWNVVDINSSTGTSLQNGVNIGSTQALELQYLWNKVGLPNPTAADAADKGAELQMAAWDVLYNTTLGTTNQDILFSGNSNSTEALHDAEDALAYAGNPTGPALAQVYALVDTQDTTQGFAFIGPPPPSNPNVSGTPLPRSAFAGLVMLGGFGGLELFRKRRGFVLPTA